ncbi:hypothetical protein F4803DRAFT_351600 [Xylaria telfairii]|nr:hypothetical protein F4803DRAFT_351600 [Xylaria telfairii]
MHSCPTPNVSEESLSGVPTTNAHTNRTPPRWTPSQGAARAQVGGWVSSLSLVSLVSLASLILLGPPGLWVPDPFENVRLADWAPHSESGTAVRQRLSREIFANSGMVTPTSTWSPELSDDIGYRSPSSLNINNINQIEPEYDKQSTPHIAINGQHHGPGLDEAERDGTSDAWRFSHIP